MHIVIFNFLVNDNRRASYLLGSIILIIEIDSETDRGNIMNHISIVLTIIIKLFRRCSAKYAFIIFNSRLCFIWLKTNFYQIFANLSLKIFIFFISIAFSWIWFGKLLCEIALIKCIFNFWKLFISYLWFFNSLSLSLF